LATPHVKNAQCFFKKKQTVYQKRKNFMLLL